MKYIYLAVWFDRHSGDSYEAFVNLEDAKSKCREWAAAYKGNYNFTEADDKMWCYFVINDEDYDESPRMTVYGVYLN